MKLNKAFFTITAIITLASMPVQAAEKEIKQANCELRLVSNAGAGEIFMSIFTRNEEECLAKSDQSVEAKFRNKSGNLVAKRGGAGPQP